MGYKTKKKAGTGSATKLKNSEEIIPIVALPTAQVGVSTTPATVKATGEVTIGKNGDSGPGTELSKSGSRTADAKSSSNLNEMENDKSILVQVAATNEAPRVPAMATVIGNVNRNTETLKTGAGVVSVQVSSNPNVLKAAQALSESNKVHLTAIEASSTGKVTNLEESSLVPTVSMEDTPVNSIEPIVAVNTQGKQVSSVELPLIAAETATVIVSGAVSSSNADRDDLLAVGKGVCEPLIAENVGAGGVINNSVGGSTNKVPVVTVELPKAPYGAPDYIGYVGDDVEKSNGEGPAPWVNLLGDNREITNGFKLKEDLDRVKPNAVNFKDMEIEEDELGKLSLVGYFASRYPGKEGVQKMVNSWPAKCRFYQHTSGWLVFTFENIADMDKVLLGGPYYVYGRTLLLKRMPKMFHFSKKEFSIVPVWLQLPNLPLAFWKPDYLSSICTFVGSPLYTNQCTVTKERISFARCLVEVDVKSNLPKIIPIILPNGELLEQAVLYENLPKYCDKCMMLGHAQDTCRGQGSAETQLYVRRLPKGVGMQPNSNSAAPRKQGTTATTKAGTNAPSSETDIPRNKPRRRRNKKKPVVHDESFVFPDDNNIPSGAKRGLNFNDEGSGVDRAKVTDGAIEDTDFDGGTTEDGGISDVPDRAGSSKQKGVAIEDTEVRRTLNKSSYTLADLEFKEVENKKKKAAGSQGAKSKATGRFTTPIKPVKGGFMPPIRQK